MITLTEVAKAAGVSRSAVSKALLGGGGKTTQVSEKNIQHIREVAAKMGYRPNLLAQRLAYKRDNIIGVIIDSQCCGLYNNIMASMERLIFDSGYRLQVGLVHDSYDAIRKYVDDLLGYNIQSVICLAHYYEFAEQIPPLFKAFKNPLFISKPMTDEPFSYIAPDYYSNMFEAVEYLISLGRRRIVFAKVAYKTIDAQERERACVDAYAAHHLEFNEQFIYQEPLGEIDTPELMNRFLDDVLPLKPDALVLGNPVAIGWCMRLLAERGITVPDKISILGMDSWPGSRAMSPSLTVIDNNYSEIAKRAVSAIFNNAGKSAPLLVQEHVRGKLVIGESCSKLN